MNYEKLDKIAEILSVDIDKYNEAKKAFFENKSNSILKYLGYEDDGEIQDFTDFWYYYLADNTNSFFHNMNSKGYVESVKRYIDQNKIQLLNVNFDDFLEKEKYYSEALFDILVSDVRYNLVDKNLDIFGISIGLNSMIYFILPKTILKQLKEIENEAGILIFDCEKLENIYGEISKLHQLIPEAPEVTENDYVEKNKENNTYTTLFDQSMRLNYTIKNLNENALELYL